MYKQFSLKNKQAMSLIEISIVLVVMGLLVSAVMSGTMVIKQAKIRSIQTEADGLLKSAYLFYINNGGWPGDFSAMSRLVPHTDADCTAASTGGTLNGNGDGSITYGDKGSAAPATASESYMFFCHLQLTSFLTTPLTYLANKATAPKIGINILKAKAGGGYVPIAPTSNGVNVLSMITPNSANADISASHFGAIPTDMASQLKSKYDGDGVAPGAGKVRVRNPAGTAASANSCVNSNTINLNVTGNICALDFLFPSVEE